MELAENKKKKAGDGYETLRVRGDLKARILKVQNDYFTQMNRKISVTDLIREALDARAAKSVAKPKRA